MEILRFFAVLGLTVTTVFVAMSYLRTTTRQIILELCHSDAGAEFWLRSSDILALAGSVVLVLVFGNSTNASSWVEAVRMTLILSLGGIFISVMFVARNVWKTTSMLDLKTKHE